MDVFFQDCLDILEKLHAEIDTALEGLPQEALDWAPAGDANSIAVLCVHTAASERYWVGDVIARESSGRDRSAEFRTRGVAAADLKARLDASLAYTRGVLERLTVAELPEERTVPPDGRTVRVGWALAHTIEHVGTHVGHIHITRQVWQTNQAKVN